MYNALNRMTTVFLNSIAHYAYGCIYYQQMGMSPKESDRFLQSLLASTVAAESAENRANLIDTPPNRARRTRTA